VSGDRVRSPIIKIISMDNENKNGKSGKPKRKLTAKDITRKAFKEELQDGYLLMNKGTLKGSEERGELTNAEKFVYLLLLRFRDRKSTISYPSMELMAEIMSSPNSNVAIQNVSRSILSLEKKGWINIARVSKREGAQTTIRNAYELLHTDSHLSKSDKITYGLVYNKLLTWEERLFMIQVYPFILWDKNEIRFSRRELEAQSGIHKTTISLRVTRLIQLGVLEEHKDKSLTIDMVRLNDLSIEQTDKLILSMSQRISKLENELRKAKSQGYDVDID